MLRFLAFGALIPFLPEPLNLGVLGIVAVLLALSVLGSFLEKQLNQPAFTHDDIPPLEGKTAVVTGGHAGVGFETALALAKKGCRVIIAARSETRGRAAVDSICDQLASEARKAGETVTTKAWPVEWRSLDLGSLKSVKRFANSFKNEGALHILVNSAEVMMCPFAMTEDGYEMQIGVNHIGHFCLTALLSPALSLAGAAGAARVVFITSKNHEQTYPGGVDFDSIRSRAGYNPQLAYGQSKLCNILAAYKFAKRLGKCGVLVNAVHPGHVDLNVHHQAGSGGFAAWGPFAPLFRLVRRPFMTVGVADAALSVMWAATSPEVAAKNITGKYVEPVGHVAIPSRFAQNQTLAKRVWDWSVEACKIDVLPEPLRERFAIDDAPTKPETQEAVAIMSPKIDADEVHKVFVWMGVSPEHDSPCGRALYRAFPGALPGSAIVKRVAGILREHNLTADNTLYGQSICSDEINNEKGDLATLMQDYWGELFPLGGIGGAPYAGRTGFTAFSHHVPENGNLLILFGPHIAVSNQGELGKYMRIGHNHHSDACGAIVAAYKQCCAEAKEARESKGWSLSPLGPRKPSHHEHDMQQSWLRSKVRPALPKINKAKTPIVELTHTVYEAINEMMHGIINHDFGSGKVVLLGGIQINLQTPYEDHFLPLTFEVSSKGSVPVDLLSKLHMADSTQVKAA